MSLAQEGATLKVRSDLHLSRKIFHFLGVCIIVYFFQILPRTEMLYTVCTLSALCLIIDLLRLKSKTINRLMINSFGAFLRRNEVIGLTGASYLALGGTVIAVIFPKEIVTISLLMLAVGDPIASTFGIMYGKDVLVGKKTLQGAIAGFVSCTLVAVIFYSTTGIMSERIILASLLTGLIGAISEITPILGLDDNFTFPILSSILLWIQFQIM